MFFNSSNRRDQEASQCQTEIKILQQGPVSLPSLNVSKEAVSSRNPSHEPGPLELLLLFWQQGAEVSLLTPSLRQSQAQPSDKSHFSHLHSKSHPPGPGYPRHTLKREGCKPSGDNYVIQELLLFSQSSPSSPRRSSWVLCIKDWAGATRPLRHSDASATEICSCKRSLWRVIVQD